MKPEKQALIRPGTEVEGLVVRTESGFHQVKTDDRLVVCRAPKRLLQGERTSTTVVVIGDRVRARAFVDDSGVIEEILPRRNQLIRAASAGKRYDDVIAANLDILAVVQAMRTPAFDPGMLDRFLVLAEAADIPALVVLNKADLAPRTEVDLVAGLYRSIGYPVIITSASSGNGVDRMREALTGKISALVGPSGAGKSSLLNRVQPGLRLRTGNVSVATGRGKHTTTTAELLPLAGGYIADTPGLGEMTMPEIEHEDVAFLFREFRPFLGVCRFSDCTHREEAAGSPGGCAVRAALQRGDIAEERYQSYLSVYRDIDEQEPFWK